MIDYMKTSDELENKYKQNKNPLFVDYKFYNKKSITRKIKMILKNILLKKNLIDIVIVEKISEFFFFKTTL